MKFTRSKDGQERASVRVTLRLHSTDVEAFKQMAARDGHKNWRQTLTSELGCQVAGIIYRFEEDENEEREFKTREAARQGLAGFDQT